MTPWGRPLKFPERSYRPGPPGDLQGTLRDQQKIDKLMKKVFFRYNSSGFTHLLLFLVEKQICKSSKWDVHGTSMGPSFVMSRGPDDGRSGEVPGT